MLRLVIVAAMLAGCATANRHVGRAALVTSTLTLVCDEMQTMRVAATNWTDRHEAGPLGMLSEHPSVGTVGAYFVGAVVLNAAAWVLTPERYRAPLPVAVTVMQTREIIGNARPGIGVCGF